MCDASSNGVSANCELMFKIRLTFGTISGNEGA